MTLSIPFDNSYARLPASLFTPCQPTPVAAPELIAFNRPLADQLGLTGADNDADLAQIFAGNHMPQGAAPLAQLYAGHQFGQWNPQLGDGRAILLGEVETDQGRFDIQLKGSGPTPYSRNGDGRAWLGPVLREYVVSEAMHALGVPTTRALAAVRTGQKVQRETALPGGVITRVARSHIRVGTFQVLAARQDIEGLTALYEHAVARHYPAAKDPLSFLQAVIDAQANLVAHWMSLGFIHGVMNTDNCAISGETIDYGPCAFMDHFHPMQVFSSIDRNGRYAYGNQPDIIVWNMAQLATALVPLMPDTDAAVRDFTEVIHAMPDLLRKNWRDRFAAKLGITDARQEDETLINGFLTLMANSRADFTQSFRALAQGSAADHMSDAAAYAKWQGSWQARIAEVPDPSAHMRAVSPYLIPRNHQIEAMIDAAVAGDDAPFHRLTTALARPYEENPAYRDLAEPPKEDEIVKATFCGT
ncbi:YdiU family protein [Cognatishimia sp. SS12]|uniref:protein adenylyltransferase SelO n=1 Tax=Cognatishimia sp. SS12 TaxID=2979465 RepID=UPI00232AE97B|nr:YdiU family protein [Cognatishimia sp. SS12]MDC0737319.1 YdiU family protein [Cognatishimia sp. SS12]